MVCCSESFPFYSHLILTGREVFFPFPPHHLLTCVRLCSSPPVCNAVPSAAASTRRHCFSFPPHHLTCMCVFFTCVQCCSKCCCFHQKALFFPFHPIVFLPVCVFPPHLCAVLFRVLLRREQVLKVACNHLISTTMELKPMATSETAWCWVATDYTDNQPHVEQFAVKFKVSQEVFFVCFLKSH